jgi:NAD(P)-dependent dehydrogenase (short-subunit alcohol dehydrogenase family)
MNANDVKSRLTEKPVWLITGCSTGFGNELARQVLERGYRTVVTARKPDEVAALAALGDALVLPLDVTDRTQIAAAVAAADKRFGRIDVLVNNAGIGYFSAIEEGEDDQVRRLFEINVFGLTHMIQAVLPGMRRRRSGFIVNLSSLAGLRSFPGLGYYNATKFAVEGLSEALWQEVEPLGIKVMLVEPSGFRTDWAGRSANDSKRLIEDYAATAGVGSHEIRTSSGHQPGDPVRAAAAIIDATEAARPPHRLLLGNAAYEGAVAKLDTLRSEFLAGEAVARGADAPEKSNGRAA